LASRRQRGHSQCVRRPTGLNTAGGKAVAVVILLFMALLSFRWNQHPEPTGSRRATPPSFFNIRRDNRHEHIDPTIYRGLAGEVI
jgi:hypothetical protein